MPTMTRESVLAAIKTALEGINGAGSYNTTQRGVFRSLFPATGIGATPVLMFTAEDTAGPPLEGGGSSSGISVWTMRVDITGYIERATANETAAHNLLHDISFAMTRDRSLGGFSRNVTPAAQSTESQEGAAEGWITVHSSWIVLYRHDYAVPSQVR